MNVPTLALRDLGHATALRFSPWMRLMSVTLATLPGLLACIVLTSPKSWRVRGQSD
jgi:hypothetical protein